MGTINVRIPSELRNLIIEFVETGDLYLNISEFARAALREKIQRDAPQLCQDLFKERFKNAGLTKKEEK